jgi:hypothetical protein
MRAFLNLKTIVFLCVLALTSTFSITAFSSYTIAPILACQQFEAEFEGRVANTWETYEDGKRQCWLSFSDRDIKFYRHSKVCPLQLHTIKAAKFLDTTCRYQPDDVLFRVLFVKNPEESEQPVGGIVDP